MFDTQIVWSNGTNSYHGKPINQFANKQLQTIADFIKTKDNLENKDKIKREHTKKIYFLGDCMFFLTKKGEVYKKGNFPYLESIKKNENKIKKLTFQNNKGIKKIKFGINHILFLDNENSVFSMGDNFYGQLGLGSFEIRNTLEPKKIGFFEKIAVEKIYVYKNTSFAIDKDKKLYGWGSSEFISNYTGNLFKPIHLFINMGINSINCMSNRVIINGNYLEGTKKDIVKASELIEVDGKKNIEDKIKEEEEKKKLLKNKNHKNSIISEEEKIQIYRNIFLKSINNMNKILSKILNFYSNSENDKMIKKAFNLIQNENSYIIKHNIKHPEISKANSLLEFLCKTRK
jgi:alpha-tubulin suppressor-like RCC1 family protein